MSHLPERKNKGLSEGNTKFIVGIIIGALVLFGPIEPFGLVIRMAYIIITPTLVWYGLRHWGTKWDMDDDANDRLTRALAALIAGALLFGAYLSYTSQYHTECTQYVQTRDGQECVGDYVTRKGSDRSGAFIKLIGAGFAIWFALSKKTVADL